MLAGLLFFGYLRVSWTVAAASDGAAQALQARDMLAGNWLLHGWTVSDVSFYTTELPEYVLVELLRPFGVGIIHVAAAVTYTLLVLAAFALARGRARGGAGLVRGLLAAGIMLAPQLGYGAFVLLLSPDHVGTQVPLLVGWLLLDRAPRRWWVPFLLCLVLAWVQFADRVALVTAVLPLVIVCAVSALQGLLWRPAGRPEGTSGHGRSTQKRKRAGPARRVGTAPRSAIALGAGATGARATGAGADDARATGARADDARADDARADDAGWNAQTAPIEASESANEPIRNVREQGWGYEVALAGAAVASVGVSWVGARVLDRAGGFAAHPLPFTLAPLRLLLTHSWLTGWGILEVFGANFLGVTGWADRTFAVIHLAGLALAIAGLAVALGRFLRPGPNARSGSLWPTQTRVRLARERDSAGAELVDSVLAVAIVVNLISYVLSIEPGTVLGTGYDAREIAAVLPLGAVLAGRMLGPKLAASMRLGCHGVRGMGRSGAKSRFRSDSPILAGLTFGFVLAGYAVAFGYSAAQPSAGPGDEVLAGWLVAHGMHYGLGGAAANIVTAESGGRAVVEAVTVRDGHMGPLLYQSETEAYDPRRHVATFLVAGTPADRPGDSAESVPAAAVRASFGPPARVYRFHGFTVDAWDVNLLTKMRE